MKLGIDYGTTTTLLSLTEQFGAESRTELINIGGKKPGYEKSSVPSLIAITKKKDLFFGYDAVEWAGVPEKQAVVLKSLKKCLACTIKQDASKSECWNVDNMSHCMGGQKLKIFEEVWEIKDLVKKFIDSILKEPAAKKIYENTKLDTIGISVPAMFGGIPRSTVFSLVLDIVSNSKNIEVVNEPTAAIIACQDMMKDEKNGLYAICDVGGGTTDIVLLEKNEDQYFLFKPEGIRIAGDDFDRILLEKYSSQVKDMSRTKALMEVRRAKEHLTLTKNVSLLGSTLTRAEFNTLIKPAVDKIVQALRAAITNVFDLYKPTSETKQVFHLQKIFLSGGGSRVPLLAEEIRNDSYFKSFGVEVGFIRNPELYKVYKDDLPIVVVAIGASMPRGNLQDSIQYMLPYSLYIKRGKNLKEKALIYQELPHEFSVESGVDSIEILAMESKGKKEVYNLTDELFSQGDEMPMYEWLKGVSSCKVNINAQNIMRVMYLRGAKTVMRAFNLPWQGGIEEAVFEKYRREWRRTHVTR